MTGIIILAAGSSSRMGEPKQQLIYQDKTLLQHAIQAAHNITGVDIKVLVVLGANNQAILTQVDSKITDVVINPDWELGMASSIKAGLTALQTVYPNAEQVLLMLCDQPFVTSALLQQLIQTGTGNAQAIVASAYQDTIGAPVLFGKAWFNNLLALQGQEGAKKLLLQHKDSVVSIPFAEGGIDIDTPDDYQKLLNK